MPTHDEILDLTHCALLDDEFDQADDENITDFVAEYLTPPSEF